MVYVESATLDKLASSTQTAERAAAHELRYLRAMASLGAGPYKASEVAAAPGKRSAQLALTRARLIEKGPLYAPVYGLAAFTVPQFDRYLLRNYAERD